MTEDEARKVELVRAIETEDRDSALLTREDREQALAYARAHGTEVGPGDELAFVAHRAEFAAARLATRHPAIAGEGRAIDRGFGALARLTGGVPRSLDHGPLQRAASAFQREWARMTMPLTRARLARTLHLGAALFALGLIGGIYLRALGVEYRAGWESTFLSPSAVRAVLAAVLGPASLATGVAIPPVDAIAAMRWTGPIGGGVNAGPWIHLYTATVVGFVVLPRLALAFWQAVKTVRLTRRFPAHGREDFYIRRQLRAASVRAGAARVTPYAYRPDAATQAHLTEALRGALGEGATVRVDEPVEYGAEDAWAASQAFDPQIDYHLLLFTASATPEAENHGALAAALAQRLKADGHGTIPAALIDEGPYRARFAGQGDLEPRLAARIAAWRGALAQSGAALLALDLTREPDAALIERIEGGLSSDGALRG